VLEPEVFRYGRISNTSSCWVLLPAHRRPGGAFSYISRAHQLKDDDVEVMLGLAAIHFRRAENESAIKQWLEVLAIDPANAVARRGLELLRRAPAGKNCRK